MSAQHLNLDAKRVRLAHIVISQTGDYRGGCNGCDDFTMPDFMSPGDIASLDADYHAWNGDPEDAGGHLGWNMLFSYLTKALLKHASEVRARAREILAETRLRPGMFAQGREALIMRTSTVVEMVGCPFDVQAFYDKHVTTEQAMSDEWARAVIDDALEMLK